MMPISDPDGYEAGHFGRVYKHIIKPACEAAGFVPVRADEVKKANLIILDILKQIVDADMVVCDLSARNPNVMYELGVRQAFDKPTVLIKDKKTPRIFDVAGLRTEDYDETLRVDTVASNVRSISAAMVATLDAGPDDVNSLIRLLSMSRATLPDSEKLSSDTAVLLGAIGELSDRMGKLEAHRPRRRKLKTEEPFPEYGLRAQLSNGLYAVVGESVYIGQDLIGTLYSVLTKGVGVIVLTPQRQYRVVSERDAEWDRLRFGLTDE